MRNILWNRSMHGPVCLAVLAVCLSGCSSGEKGYSGPTGTVSGTVTIDGESAPEGTIVQFSHQSGFAATGEVGSDGTYQITTRKGPEIRTGEYTVTVKPPTVELTEEQADKIMENPDSQPPEAPASPIPEKYRNTATSGLSFEVQEGENNFDIELQQG